VTGAHEKTRGVAARLGWCDSETDQELGWGVGRGPPGNTSCGGGGAPGTMRFGRLDFGGWLVPGLGFFLTLGSRTTTCSKAGRASLASIPKTLVTGLVTRLGVDAAGAWGAGHEAIEVTKHAVNKPMLMMTHAPFKRRVPIEPAAAWPGRVQSYQSDSKVQQSRWCDVPRSRRRRAPYTLQTMPSEPFYITTPIYYVNDRPHVGHCYTTIVADAIARFQRMAGRDVFFLTGTDEHGQKVEKSAQARGISAQQLADENAEHFKAALKYIGSSNDDFIRTTEARHEKQVQEALSRLLKSGDIYLGEFEGWYDEGQEEYVPENTAREKGYKAFNGQPLVRAKEENYYFRLSKYAGWLKELIAKGDEFAVQPEARRNEVLGRLNAPEGLQDVPISRTNFTWGIPVPVPPAKDGGKHITYVWIDALLNYASAVGLIDESALPAGQRGRKKYWPAQVHLIGKEILWFHAVIWPAMLKALDLARPRTVYAHSFWIRDGKKMSKTLGNFIDLPTIEAYCNAYGLDAWRWFMLTQGPLEATDADFSHAKFVEVYNADLANGIGNAFSRVSNMIEKYFGGKCPEPQYAPKSMTLHGQIDDSNHEDYESIATSASMKSGVIPSMFEHVRPAHALGLALGLTQEVDKLIHRTEPFKLWKLADQQPRVATLLYCSAEAIRIAAVLLSPAMPNKMGEILRRFGQEAPDAQGRFSRPLGELCAWGGLKPGTPIVKGEGLFPRIDPAAPAPASA